MKKLRMFQIDAFTSEIFSGNPAAVCPLTNWLENVQMQAIAAENNLSETAFFIRNGDNYKLRWFTPLSEVNLCGHATLASAFVIFNFLEPSRNTVKFETLSGSLEVSRQDELLTMNFPNLEPIVCKNSPSLLIEGLGKSPQEVLLTEDNYFALLESENEVRAVQPNLSILEQLHPYGVVVTAPGKDVDFVSRYFAPSYGIPEDPVTGSIHCTLIPYWADRLGKSELHARQVSSRGGELFCKFLKDRVAISGRAVRYFDGYIYLNS